MPKTTFHSLFTKDYKKGSIEGKLQIVASAAGKSRRRQGLSSIQIEKSDGSASGDDKPVVFSIKGGSSAVPRKRRQPDQKPQQAAAWTLLKSQAPFVRNGYKALAVLRETGSPDWRRKASLKWNISTTGEHPILRKCLQFPTFHRQAASLSRVSY